MAKGLIIALVKVRRQTAVTVQAKGNSRSELTGKIKDLTDFFIRRHSSDLHLDGLHFSFFQFADLTGHIFSLPIGDKKTVDGNVQGIRDTRCGGASIRTALLQE